MYDEFNFRVIMTKFNDLNRQREWVKKSKDLPEYKVNKKKLRIIMMVFANLTNCFYTK